MSVNNLLSPNDTVLYCGEIYNKDGLITNASSNFPTVYVNTSPYTAPAMNTKYITNFPSGTMLFTLPATANTGDEIVICNISSTQGIQISPGGSNIFIMNNNVSMTTSALVNFTSGINNSTITFIYLVTNIANNFWIIKDMTNPYYDPITTQYVGLHSLSQMTDCSISPVPTLNQILKWTGTHWSNRNQSTQVFLNSHGTNLTDGYIKQDGFTTNGAEATYSFAQDSVITGFYVQINVAPGVHAWTFNIMKNGIDTGLSVHLTGPSATSGSVSGSISYNAGDNFALQVVKTGGPPATQYAYATILYN